MRTPGGQTIVKTQFGGADIKRHASGASSGRPLSIADDYKAAASDALKKCASLLGIGLDLYGRDRPELEEGPQSKPEAPAAPTREKAQVIDVTESIASANGRTGFCTPTQEREIRRLAIQATMTVDELCASLGVTDLAQLTEARAQRVIGRLRELVTQAADSEAS